MRGFKCCLGCGQRCEDCHSTCQPYKKEKTIHELLSIQKRKNRMQDVEFDGYNKEKSKRIEKAARRKYK